MVRTTRTTRRRRRIRVTVTMARDCLDSAYAWQCPHASSHRKAGRGCVTLREGLHKLENPGTSSNHRERRRRAQDPNNHCPRTGYISQNHAPFHPCIIRYWRAQGDRTRLRQREDVDHDRDVDHLCARVRVCVCPLSQAVARTAVRPSPDRKISLCTRHDDHQSGTLALNTEHPNAQKEWLARAPAGDGEMGELLRVTKGTAQ
jgi:hypothetical protein